MNNLPYLALLIEETQFPIYEAIDWFENESIHLNDKDFEVVLEFSWAGMAGGLAGAAFGGIPGAMAGYYAGNYAGNKISQGANLASHPNDPNAIQGVWNKHGLEVDRLTALKALNSLKTNRFLMDKNFTGDKTNRFNVWINSMQKHLENPYVLAAAQKARQNSLNTKQNQPTNQQTTQNQPINQPINQQTLGPGAEYDGKGYDA